MTHGDARIRASSRGLEGVSRSFVVVKGDEAVCVDGSLVAFHTVWAVHDSAGHKRGVAMKIFQRVLSGCAVLLLSSSALAQITLYEHEDFRGRSIFIDGPEPNLKELHFNDLASALVVERGAWEICHDANFRGRCYVLERGEYRWMRDLDFNDKISSVRPVDARRHGRHDGAPWSERSSDPRRVGRFHEVDVMTVRAVYGHGRGQCWVEDRGAAGHRGQRDFRRGDEHYDDRGHDHGRARGRDMPRCRDTRQQGAPLFWDVSYVFRGEERWTRLQRHPGRRITVNGRGEVVE